jgi:hypothetical protein
VVRRIVPGDDDHRHAGRFGVGPELPQELEAGAEQVLVEQDEVGSELPGDGGLRLVDAEGGEETEVPRGELRGEQARRRRPSLHDQDQAVELEPRSRRE